MKERMFKIWDNQLNEYRWDWQWFTTSNAVDSLADFHSIDWKWVNDDDSEQTIYEFLDTLKSEEERLSFLMEHWDWDIHHCIFRASDVCIGWDYYRDDTLDEFIADHADINEVEMETRFYFNNDKK
jgi:hypothetical protein